MPTPSAASLFCRLGLAVWLPSGLCAQHDAAPAPKPGHTPSSAPATHAPTGKRTPAATHAPQPSLHPLLAWQHVKNGNAAAAAAIARQEPLPAPAARPAGAGRYLCAVLVCADCDADVPALLGLRREDVLLVSVPGPFASAESLALLERAVADDRLSLVLVLGHSGCRTLQPQRPTEGEPAADALTRRAEVVHKEAARRQQPVVRTLVQMQRELLLAASESLPRKVAIDELRVFPGELDARTGVLTWHHQSQDAMPLAPVK